MHNSTRQLLSKAESDSETNTAVAQTIKPVGCKVKDLKAERLGSTDLEISELNQDCASDHELVALHGEPLPSRAASGLHDRGRLPRGQYDLALKSEGSCTTLITSTTECEAAASTLGLRDNTVKTFSSATRPPGC